jgi:hypothetical protein
MFSYALPMRGDCIWTLVSQHESGYTNDYLMELVVMNPNP